MSTMTGFAAGGPREAQWRAVAQAMEQGLPQTALERLEPIFQAALGEEAWAEAARALGQRIALQTRIQGGRAEEQVRRYRQALSESPQPLHAVLHTLLGHAYWGYFAQNRWRIQQRTAAAGESEDFEAWDLRRLFSEIDRQFSLALANEAVLKAIPISDYAALLEEGSVPDRYRPTLYDFLAFEALDFYSAGEQAGARPEDAFVLDAESPILGTISEFLEWEPVTTDTNAVALKAVRLFQSLLRFHAEDPDPSAFVDADRLRIQYGGNVATGARRDERYLGALRGLAERARNHEVSALVRHHEASLLMRQEKYAEAHAVAREAAERFPESPGGLLCRNLVLQIEAPSARVLTERAWNEPWPVLEVHHKNLNRLWFRAVAADWNGFIEERRNRPEDLNRDQRLSLLREAPALEWSAELPATPDYNERVTKLPAPTTLQPGFYFILASRRDDFGEADNEVTAVPVWVSNLALVVRTRAEGWEGFVLRAGSGEPVPGARVEAWFLDRRGVRLAAPARTTEADGTFVFERPGETRAYLFKAMQGGHAVAMADDSWWGGPRQERRPDERTVFFTDRGLYRPGQLIQYKGICLAADTERDRYEAIGGRPLTVVLHDINGRELERATHRANDFGSFSGTFTAPASGVTGALRLFVEGTPPGETSVRVEEYKRPRFHVSLEAPAQPPRLNERVSVTGRALAYTGAAIDGAQVRWRVVRQVRFPPWLSWLRGGWPGVSEAQEIAHGTSVTRADGSFTIDFPATPAPAVDPETEPVFRFEVHADVTDTAGETRSSERQVSVGYTALAAELTAEGWQTSAEPVAIRITTKTLDDAGTSVAGTLKVYRLEQPARVQRKPIEEFHPRGSITHREPDLSNPDDWELGAVIAEQRFQTDTAGVATHRFSLAPGAYRAVLETVDRYGEDVTARLPLMVIDPEAASLNIRVPHLLAARSWTVEPGEEFVAIWGTGYETGRAFVEIEHRDRLVRRFWTEPGRTQQRISLPVTEAMRGGVTLHVTYIRENRSYSESRRIEVPWTNKELEITWGTFRSRLEPGQQETWTASIKPRGGSGATGERAAAEMVATLYDASLDQFLAFNWPDRFNCFPQFFSTARTSFSNAGRWFEHVHGRIDLDLADVEITYRHFPDELVQRWGWGGGFGGGGGIRSRAFRLLDLAAEPSAMAPALMMREGDIMLREDAAALAAEKGADAAPRSIDPSLVPLRRNLNETAFFLPHLTSDSEGVVRLTFTLPEALTEWRFLGFAHDRALRSGLLEGTTVTAKELMVQPNPPRFLREGDQLEFTAKVVNESAARVTGRVRLSLSFTLDGSEADIALGNSEPELVFEIGAKESRAFSWRLEVPDGCGFLTYRVAAASERFSDGEVGYLPVLSRRVFLTESMPLPIRGPGQKQFTFKALGDADSSTLEHAGLTVQMVSNPAWYAVLALPYLMEYPHECTEQVFGRFYANSLARHIARSDPRIRAVFDQWRGTDATDSPLLKNASLKAVAIEETPWLRRARNESQARRNVALLFEEDRLNAELERAIQQLADAQMADGGWSWFPGGPRDDYITLYLVTGFGRLRHLGIEMPNDIAIRALSALDAWMHQRWERLREEKNLDEANLTPIVALYLYGRSFFLEDQAVEQAHRPAFEYWTEQARKHWLKLEHRMPRGHLALALNRMKGHDGNRQTAAAIVRSLREHAVHSDEMGMFWREDERSWWWYRAPIETQALMVEVVDEVARDSEAVEDLKVWLLKQKQTQAWQSTKATADAVYALILRGTDLLASTELAQIQLGNRPIRPASNRQPRAEAGAPPEAGTGFYEIRIPAGEVSSELSKIEVSKAEAGVAWGSVHWQYFEDLSKVRGYEGAPLKLTKALFTRVNTGSGRQLVPVSGPVKIGDELVVRVELRVDRDMEYIHLKDQRGSGTEPVNVLSRYRFQDGLGYYESTRDTASHFFVSYLPKGTYVFEYPLWVQHRGEYSTGFAEVQCMYAPEFNSHSRSLDLWVQ
jgi:hypothetical protein